MPAPNDQQTVIITTTRQDHRIAWLTALAIAIHIAESVLPSPLPGVKPGLANVVTLTVLFLYGWSAAVWVSLLRVLVGSLLIGTFLTPTFALSLSGALASLVVLGLGTLLPGRGLGPVGFALLASLAGEPLLPVILGALITWLAHSSLGVVLLVASLAGTRAI
ncbi:MAG: Gx transporter family protein, partial [Gammaproteobacteria bacterium]